MSFFVLGETYVPERLQSFRHNFFSSFEGLRRELHRAAKVNLPKLCIVDAFPGESPELIETLLTPLRQSSVRTIAIEASFGREDLFDLVFVPSPEFKTTDVSGRLLFGWECLFATARPTFEWSFLERVLVSTGGGDPTDLGAAWPALLEAKLKPGTVIDWIVGPYAQPPALPSPSSLTWNLHRSPSDLIPLIDKAGVVLTVMGVSLFEALARGKAVVTLSPYGGRDHALKEVLRQEGVAIVAESAAEAVNELSRLLREPLRAKSLAEKAHKKMTECRGEIVLLEAATQLLGVSPGPRGTFVEYER